MKKILKSMQNVKIKFLISCQSSYAMTISNFAWILVRNLNYWLVNLVLKNAIRCFLYGNLKISFHLQYRIISKSSISSSDEDKGEKKGSCEHINGVCTEDICTDEKVKCKLPIVENVIKFILCFYLKYLKYLKANLCIMLAKKHSEYADCFDKMGSNLNKCWIKLKKNLLI